MTYGARDLDMQHFSRDFGQRLSDSIRENPIPAALVGMGVAWLFSGGTNKTLSDMVGQADVAGTVSDAGSRMARAAGRMGSTVSQTGAEMASSSATGMSEMVSSATEMVADTAAAAQRRGNRMIGTVQRDLTDLFDRQPLAVGAFGLLLGAAIGTAFQTTKVESEMLGAASQALKDQAQEFASSAAEQAKAAAAELTGSSGSTEDTLRAGAQKAAAVAETALDAARDQLQRRTDQR